MEWFGYSGEKTRLILNEVFDMNCKKGDFTQENILAAIHKYIEHKQQLEAGVNFDTQSQNTT